MNRPTSLESTLLPDQPEYTNILGMTFRRIEQGIFLMGFEGDPLDPELSRLDFRLKGDFDEYPRHPVTITRPFFISVCEVTNVQYEQFAPEHRKLRGKLGFSKEDDAAVVFVDWHEATAFCEWLSEKEGLPHRLPTEAEWEYACRAGTTTPFHTGNALPKNFHKNVGQSWYPDVARGGPNEVVSLTVGQTPANPWGLYDMHGNVEEWCYDWYGPYEAEEPIDPVGRVKGDFRVTRGGSHSTELYYSRSANRMGGLPHDKHWLIGFRVVIGSLPRTEPLPALPPERYQLNVRQEKPVISLPDPETPYFSGPRKYVKIPDDSRGPLFSHHNHDPALVACPNGDLLAIWYTCVEERGRELGLLVSRLRYGADEWEPASVFWNTPDRNNHAPAFWCDGVDTIYHFCGLSVAATWGNLATTLRLSKDNGVTWSEACLIIPEHGPRHMPIESVFRAEDGTIILPCDAVTGGNGGTALWMSRDEGETWDDAGGTIAGIHAGVVQLKDGRLMALGRGNNIDGRMPMSLSEDMGKTWEYRASPFVPVSGGQRLVLMRLREGPIFLASFTGSNRKDPSPMLVKDISGSERPVRGLFGTLSFDEGETWPCIRLISDDGPGRSIETMDGRLVTMGFDSAEPGGYMSGCQDADGIIHLISSRQHYAFNLAWLKTLPPAAPITTTISAERRSPSRP